MDDRNEVADRAVSGRPDVSSSAIDAAVAALRAGDAIGLPTETVYGLGADASNEAAVQRIFAIKGRPAGHPLIVHIASVDALPRWSTGTNQRALALADAFWPGPLTVIVESSGEAAPAVTGGRSTVGLRVPAHPVALAVLERFDGGVAAPSANRFGRVSPTTAAHVWADLGDAIDVVLDGGPSGVGVESTIVELVGPTPILLRPGGISVEAIESVLGESLLDGRQSESRAAGMMASHYAPNAPVVVVDSISARPGGETDDGGAGVRPPRVRVIAPMGATGLDPGDDRTVWLPADPAGYAEGLYAALRMADTPDVEQIIVVVPSERGPLLPAVLDRLSKASAPR